MATDLTIWDETADEMEVRGQTLALVRRASRAWERYCRLLAKRGHTHGGRTQCDLCENRIHVSIRLLDLLGDLLSSQIGDEDD